MSKRYEGSPLTDAAQQVLALEGVIAEMDGELSRLRVALKAIANAHSGESASALRYIAKQAVEGGRA